MKLENVLLLPPEPGKRLSGKIEVIDFGSACVYGRPMQIYIQVCSALTVVVMLSWTSQSRFYRAPEVILGIGFVVAPSENVYFEIPQIHVRDRHVVAGLHGGGAGDWTAAAAGRD